MKKHVNMCGCFKHINDQQEENAFFLIAGVKLVHLLELETILATLFWIQCNLQQIELTEIPER